MQQARIGEYVSIPLFYKYWYINIINKLIWIHWNRFHPKRRVASDYSTDTT
jgi:hypothetical protein